ncbi:MAG: hypothetical protein ACMXYK_03355, partial [Candidatus Woesearchaeota archaeon]
RMHGNHEVFLEYGRMLEQMSERSLSVEESEMLEFIESLEPNQATSLLENGGTVGMFTISFADDLPSYAEKELSPDGQWMIQIDKAKLDAERIRINTNLQTDISDTQLLHITLTHTYGEGVVGTQNPDGTFNKYVPYGPDDPNRPYTTVELLGKARMLSAAGFNQEQRRILMEYGHVGRNHDNSGDFQEQQDISFEESQESTLNYFNQFTSNYMQSLGKVESIREIMDLAEIYEQGLSDDSNQRIILNQRVDEVLRDYLSLFYPTYAYQEFVGLGYSGVALLVNNNGKEEVLKIGIDSSFSAEKEYALLRGLGLSFLPQAYDLVDSNAYTLEYLDRLEDIGEDTFLGFNEEELFDIAREFHTAGFTLPQDFFNNIKVQDNSLILIDPGFVTKLSTSTSVADIQKEKDFEKLRLFFSNPLGSMSILYQQMTVNYIDPNKCCGVYSYRVDSIGDIYFEKGDLSIEISSADIDIDYLKRGDVITFRTEGRQYIVFDTFREHILEHVHTEIEYKISDIAGKASYDGIQDRILSYRLADYFGMRVEDITVEITNDGPLAVIEDKESGAYVFGINRNALEEVKEALVSELGINEMNTLQEAFILGMYLSDQEVLDSIDQEIIAKSGFTESEVDILKRAMLAIRGHEEGLHFGDN